MFNALKKYLQRPSFFFLISFLIFLILYGQTLGFAYVWDDKKLMVANLDILNQPLSWELLARPVIPATSYLRPLIFITWWLEVQAYGKFIEPVSHLINIVIYYLVVLLTYALLKRLTREYKHSTALACIGALIFLVHPAHVWTVAWVSGRFDLMANLFIFSALLIFLNVKNKLLKNSLIAVLFVLALGSKETGVLLIPFLLLIDLYDNFQPQASWGEQIKRSFRENKLLLYVLLALTVIYLVIRAKYGSGLYHAGISSYYIENYYLKRQVPVLSLSSYITFTLFPFSTYSLVASPLEEISANSFYVISSWLTVLLTLGLSAYLLAKRNRTLLTILGYLTGISLVIYIIPISVGSQLRADRFLMISLPFFCLFLLTISNGFYGLLQNERQRSYFCIFAGLYFFGTLLTTALAIPHWKNDERRVIAINKYYLHYTQEENRYYKEYITYLTAKKENKPILAAMVDKELELAQRDEKRKFNFELVDIYGYYLIDKFNDPEGLRLLKLSEEMLENRTMYHTKFLQDFELSNVYFYSSKGELFINQNVKAAKEYMDKLKNIDRKYLKDDLVLLQQDVLVNVLANDRKELAYDLSIIQPYKKVQYLQNSPMELLTEYVDFHIKKLCKKKPEMSDQCHDDFSFAKLVQELQ